MVFVCHFSNIDHFYHFLLKDFDSNKQILSFKIWSNQKEGIFNCTQSPYDSIGDAILSKTPIHIYLKEKGKRLEFCTPKNLASDE